jgi:16S rRNA C1402 (ribose-2'-O) methylase RsmI
MNKNLVFRLIQPLREGSVFPSGVTLEAIEVHQDGRDHRKDKAHLCFSSGLVIIIANRVSGASAFQTTNFRMSIEHTEAVLSASDKEVMLAVKARIQENDTETPAHLVQQLIAPVEQHPDPADIWLIPGAIGNPLDLTIRTLRVLKTVDLIAIEAGSEAGVEHIFELFKLGPVPPMCAIGQEDDEASLVQYLQTARTNGQSVALFGVDEGLPTICDPGWKVMAAASHLQPPPRIKSISCGSALSTALMYSDQNRSEYLFLGLFLNMHGTSAFLNKLYRLVPAPWSGHKTMLCFADGKQLQTHWNRLISSTRFMRGRLSLLCNLSRHNEYMRQFSLSALPGTLPDFLAPDDKIVVRVEWNAHLFDFDWLPRLIRRILTPWR